MDSQLPHYPVIQTPGEGGMPCRSGEETSPLLPSFHPQPYSQNAPGTLTWPDCPPLPPPPPPKFLHWFNEYMMQRPN